MEEIIKKYYKNQNVLVLGGFVFIGSNLSHILAKQVVRFTIVDSLNRYCGGNKFNISQFRNKVNLIIEDVLK